MMRPDEPRSGVSPIVALAALALAASFVLPAAARGRERPAEPRPVHAEACEQVPRAL